MRFADTHIHLVAPEWRAPPQARLAEAAACGIGLLLQPGVRAADWDALLALARQPGVCAAPGLHPFCAAEWSEALAMRLRDLCRLPQVVALGEIGLDALVGVEPALQERVFRAQLEIAIEANLPVLLHCRKKTAALLDIFGQLGGGKIAGILHGFSGSRETARRALELGLLIGVGPVLLRENARKLPELVRQLPATALVLETDAPDMAAGPEVLLQVAARVAELRGWSLVETAEITTANARRLLKLEDET